MRKGPASASLRSWLVAAGPALLLAAVCLPGCAPFEGEIGFDGLRASCVQPSKEVTHKDIVLEAIVWHRTGSIAAVTAVVSRSPEPPELSGVLSLEFEGLEPERGPEGGQPAEYWRARFGTFEEGCSSLTGGESTFSAVLAGGESETATVFVRETSESEPVGEL